MSFSLFISNSPITIAVTFCYAPMARGTISGTSMHIRSPVAKP